MSLINNLGKISLILALTVTLATPSFVNAVADSINPNEESKLLNEKILDSVELQKISELKSSENVKFLGDNINVSKEKKGGKAELDKEKDSLKKLTPIESLSVKERNLDNDKNLNSKQKKSQKQIDRIISKYIVREFGTQSTIFNISETQRSDLEKFITSNDKIIKLNEILVKSIKDDGSIKVDAAWWESCQEEYNFDSFVPYEYKYNYGTKSNWVGRVANEQSEVSGNSPCDYSFYLNGSPANKVDAWTNPLECAVKWSNGISKKTYGTNNQKMIIGWGRMTACGVPTWDTNGMYNNVQFYN
jgi:hypothetical protein